MGVKKGDSPRPPRTEDPLTYEEAKELARHTAPEVRKTLAAREDIRSEILYFLAEDPSPEVRRQIAANVTAPHQADLLLAADEDEQVRTDVAAKIAKLAPGLTADEHDRLRHMTFESLEILARDQVTRVRQILSDTLKDVADAPPELIRRLARDVELVVAGPVLEFSPVLTDEDLLEIIKSSPVKGALGAISRRATVKENVVDAVAAGSDEEAIADLLANRGAQVREQTLDKLVERAKDIELWHEPLAYRPKLSQGAAKRIAILVADNLLEAMGKRRDLDPETLAEVKEVVHRRIDEGEKGKDGKARKSGGKDAAPEDQSPAQSEDAPPAEKVEQPMVVARRLHKNGKLGKKAVTRSLRAGDHDFVLAALAVRAELSLGIVQKIFSTRSAKGIIAIAWKAGMPMTVAVPLQQRTARIDPRHVLKPGEDGQFPLTVDEMKWQLEFFGDLSGS